MAAIAHRKYRPYWPAGTSNRKTRTPEDLILAIQRQMIGVLTHTVTEEPASSGAWSVTAAVGEHEGLDQASVLLPKNPWADGAYDLSVILSLLTGRHVRIGNDVEPYLTVSAGLALTSKNFFRTHPVIN